MANNKLNRLQKMNDILAKKIDAARKAQQDFLKEQRTLVKEINQEKILKVGTEIQRVGFPLDKLSLILGLALYGKELLDNDSNEEAKKTILSLMERYQKYEKEQEAKKKPAPAPRPKQSNETMDDDIV